MVCKLNAAEMDSGAVGFGGIPSTLRLRLMTLLVFITVAAPALNTFPVAADDRSVDPLELYGDRLDFSVFREGELVGQHAVVFEKRGADLRVESVFEIEVRFLVFTAYTYRYESRSRWRGGELEHLVASVDDDGTLSTVTAVASPDGLTVSGPMGTVFADRPVYPTNHWNPGVLTQSKVFNTITGAINTVQIVPIDREIVETELGPVWATRYAYSGELENQVLYDDLGRWVGMKFDGWDGSEIEYICRRCQGGASLAVWP